MVLKKEMRINKYLVYGLVAVLVLNMLYGESSAKLLFCKNCRVTRSTTDPSVTTLESTSVNTANILTAPTKCRPGQVPDRKNFCRKLVYNY